MRTNLPFTELKGDSSGRDFVGQVAEEALGVVGSTGIDIIDVLGGRAGADVLLPNFIRNRMKAIEGHGGGIRRRSGKHVMDITGRRPLKYTAGEAALKASGFNPSRIANMSRARWDWKQMNAAFNSKKRRLYAELREAIQAKDTKKRREIEKKLAKLNRDAQKSGQIKYVAPVSGKGIISSFREASPAREAVYLQDVLNKK